MQHFQKENFKSIILGIDPGTKITGYGVICIEHNRFCALDYGCVKPPASFALSARYRIIFEALNKLIEKFSPTAIAVEAQFVNKNPASTIKLGMAKGVAILAASLREIPIFEYAPARAKKAVTGQGAASKVQVQKMIRSLLKLVEDPEPEDAADALALAICHGCIWQRKMHEKHQI